MAMVMVECSEDPKGPTRFEAGANGVVVGFLTREMDSNKWKIWKDILDDDSCSTTEPCYDFTDLCDSDDAFGDLDSFKTARTSISVFSDSGTFKGNCFAEESSSDSPNKLQFTDTGEWAIRRRPRKQKKLKEKRHYCSKVLSNNGKGGLSNSVVYSPSSKQKQRLGPSQRFSPERPHISCWGDLGSIEVSRQLSSCSSTTSTSEQTKGWLDSSLDTSTETSCSQGVDESWDELFISPVTCGKGDTGVEHSSQSEGQRWLTDLLGDDAVKRMDEGARGIESLTGGNSTNGDITAKSNMPSKGVAESSVPSETSQRPVESELLSVGKSNHDSPNLSRVSIADIGYTRSIRFADEQGLPIQKVHHLGGEGDPMATCQLVLLLLVSCPLTHSAHFAVP